MKGHDTIILVKDAYGHAEKSINLWTQDLYMEMIKVDQNSASQMLM